MQLRQLKTYLIQSAFKKIEFSIDEIFRIRKTGEYNQFSSHVCILRLQQKYKELATPNWLKYHVSVEIKLAANNIMPFKNSFAGVSIYSNHPNVPNSKCIFKEFEFNIDENVCLNKGI